MEIVKQNVKQKLAKIGITHATLEFENKKVIVSSNVSNAMNTYKNTKLFIIKSFPLITFLVFRTFSGYPYRQLIINNI